MFLRNLQWRLVWIFISITLIIMIAVWFVLTQSVESTYYKTFRDGIRSGFENWEILKSGSAPKLDDLLESLEEKSDAKTLFYLYTENRSVTVIRKSDLKIEYSSDKRFSEDGGFLLEITKSRNLQAALAGRMEGGEPELTHTGRTSFFDYARTISLDKGDYILYFRYDRDEWSSVIGDFNRLILLSAFIAVLMSFVIGYILSKTITVPIVNLMHKAQKISQGDFDQLLEVRSNDEIGKLTAAFNLMAKELKSNMTQISSEKSKLETILNCMTDGVIAFNIKGEVIHANPEARKMLDMEDAIPDFNRFAEKYSVNLRLEEIRYLESAGVRERTLNFNGRWIKAYFALYTDEQKKIGGIIAVLQDITEQQKLDEMRRDFVANVSHELRTPLTSIKGCSETLLEDDLEDRETARRYLGIINSEVDRMNRLVRDLLQLSRLDNNQMNWNVRDVQLPALVRGCLEKLQLAAGSKNQVIESYTIGDIPSIKADADRIEQVVLNILANAIKYTPDGGKITIYMGKTYSDVYIKVVDTGIGIPEQDISRIFERFYRVDKARSREAGGTGLGLAIAKEIIEAHKGTIHVSSKPAEGAEFTIRLPLSSGLLSV